MVEAILGMLENKTIIWYLKLLILSETIIIWSAVVLNITYLKFRRFNY